MKRITLLVSSCSSRGVKSLAWRLREALKLDGHAVRVELAPCLPGKGLVWEAHTLRRLASWQPHAVVSLNNHCRLPCLAASRRGYFLHGYVPGEGLHGLSRGPGTARYQAGLVLASSLLSRASPARPICHSVTACEANGIDPGKAVILPQFLLPGELARPRHGKLYDLVAYTSSVRSPRIMSREAILALLRYTARRRPGSRLLLVDPESPGARVYNVGGSKLVIAPYIPRSPFLEVLSSAKIYLERSLDEEVGSTSLEALAGGAAVAKITAPSLQDRQDYSDNEVIVSVSLRDLIEKVVDALTSGAWQEYASRGRRWLLERRLWERVNRGFYESLLSL